MRRLYSSEIQEATDKLEDFLQSLPSELTGRYVDFSSMIRQLEPDARYKFAELINQKLQDLEQFAIEIEEFQNSYKKLNNLKLNLEEKKKMIESMLKESNNSTELSLLEKLNKLPTSSEKEVFNLVTRTYEVLKLKPNLSGKLDNLYLKAIRSLRGKTWIYNAQTYEKWKNIFQQLRQLDKNSKNLSKIIQRFDSVDTRQLRRSSVSRRLVCVD